MLHKCEWILWTEKCSAILEIKCKNTMNFKRQKLCCNANMVTHLCNPCVHCAEQILSVFNCFNVYIQRSYHNLKPWCYVFFFFYLLCFVVLSLFCQALEYRESLHCVLTAFKILSDQGAALNIDPTRFYTHLYTNLFSVHAGTVTFSQ